MTRPALLTLALTFIGCADAPDAPAGETYAVRGVFEGTRFEGAAVTISHEAVPGRMEAMRMDFRLADTADVSRLTPGRPVRFSVVETPSGTRAFGFHVLPDSTRLHLAPPADSASAHNHPAP